MQRLPTPFTPAGPFRVHDVASLLGTNARRVEGWVEQGPLKPAVRGRGPGRPHQFDLANLVQAALMLELQSVIGDKSRFTSLIVKGVRDAANVVARSVQKGELESDRVLLVAHRSETGPFDFKVGSLSEHQAVIDRAMKVGWTITLVGINGLLTKLHDALEKRLDPEAKR